LENSIETIGLTKYYGSLLAVDHISLNVKVGEVFGFLWPNGAGKTTTIRMLVGLTTPSEGSATVAGYDVRNEIVEVKRRIGVVPEVSNLYDELSVWDNLLFSSRLYHVPKSERADRISELLEAFSLRDRRGTKFGKLSKGLKRRVVISAALVHHPQIVFMDEPTSGLDVVSAISLRRFIRELGEKETTVFLTTHYIEEADQLSDRVAIIVQGRVLVVDTPENIRRSSREAPFLEVCLSRPPDESMIHVLEKAGKVENEGNRLRVEAKDLMNTLENIVRLAKQHGVDITDVDTVHQSLEDAFVAMTGVSPESMKVEKEGRR
jgi:ABC-2 type transport system ATP-binding protein